MYLYLVGIVFLAAASTAFQCKFKPEPEDEEKGKYDSEASEILAKYNSLSK